MYGEMLKLSLKFELVYHHNESTGQPASMKPNLTKRYFKENNEIKAIQS